MSGLHIGALGLRLPRREAAPAAARLVEDACRTCGIGWDGRLLLIRRLDLGRISSGSGRSDVLAARIADLLRAAARSAVRADGPKAASPFSESDPANNAVIYPSAAAARAVLACSLLRRGQAPAGWWWRQAAPEWDGGGNPAVILAGLMRSPEGRAALAAEAARGAPWPVAEEIRAETAQALISMWPAPPLPVPAARAPQVWRALQQRIAAAPFLAAEHAWALRLIEAASAVPSAPLPPASLLRAPIPLARSVDTAPPIRPSHVDPTQRRPASAAVVGKVTSVADCRAATPAAPRRPSQFDPTQRLPASAAVIEKGTSVADGRATTPAPADVAVLTHQPAQETFSRFAGLFLLAQPLRHLGFPVWLGRHSALAEVGLGWHLLDHVAERAGAAPEDPARSALWRQEVEIPLLAKADAMLALWRAALDGWFRRRCGIPLSSVIRRHGWIVRSEAALSLRYPVEAADIRLRRRGVDIDPGFVPWLGLSVHYYYDDRPIG